ncbi:MAG TPA: hypothetical protein VLL27_03680 [Solirubrobacterales bacterium]|nr:hypothetical protein [Solirubrobacterales bacterium]
MNEYLFVAITGLSSLLAAVIMARGTRSASRNSFLVELTKVKAGTERDQEANRERARCNREATYKEFVTAFNSTFNIFGTAMDREQAEKFCQPYLDMVSTVILIAPPQVRKAAHDANDAYEKVWPALDALENESPEKSSAECWREVTTPVKIEMKSLGPRLMSAMQHDITAA